MIIKIKNIGYCQYLKFDRNNDNENYFRLGTVFDHNKIFRKIAIRITKKIIKIIFHDFFI